MLREIRYDKYCIRIKLLEGGSTGCVYAKRSVTSLCSQPLHYVAFGADVNRSLLSVIWPFSFRPCVNSMKRQGAHDRALEWETGPTAEALEKFKTEKIHAGILAKVGQTFIRQGRLCLCLFLFFVRERYTSHYLELFPLRPFELAFSYLGAHLLTTCLFRSSIDGKCVQHCIVLAPTDCSSYM